MATEMTTGSPSRRPSASVSSRMASAGSSLPVRTWAVDDEEVGGPLQVAHLAGELQGRRAERAREHEVPELEVAERRTLEDVDEEALVAEPLGEVGGPVEDVAGRVVHLPVDHPVDADEGQQPCAAPVGGVGRQGPQLDLHPRPGRRRLSRVGERPRRRRDAQERLALAPQGPELSGGLVEEPDALLDQPGQGRRLPGPQQELGVDPRIVDEVQRLLVGRCGRRGCAEGGGAIAGPLVGLGRPPAQLVGVGGVRVGVERLAGGARRSTSATSAPPSGYATWRWSATAMWRCLRSPAGQVVVDDRPHESLCELELASFRRQRVPDDGEDLPSHEAGEEVVELCPRRLGDRVDGGAGEAGAEHREVADERALLRWEQSSRATRSAVRVAGTSRSSSEPTRRGPNRRPAPGRGRRAIGRSRRRRAGFPRPGRRCARPRRRGGRPGRRGAAASMCRRGGRGRCWCRCGAAPTLVGARPARAGPGSG